MLIKSRQYDYKNLEELIQDCLEGNEKAYYFMYQQFAPTMMGICRRYTKSLMDAEEVLSNGFIKVFKYLDRYENRGSFEGWVKRIMVRESLSYLRSKSQLLFADFEPTEMNVQIQFYPSYEVDTEYLMSMIDGLPTGYRTVFNLYAIDGYSHAEIAKMLDIEEATSKTQLHRARNSLKKKWEAANDAKINFV